MGGSDAPLLVPCRLRGWGVRLGRRRRTPPRRLGALSRRLSAGTQRVSMMRRLSGARVPGGVSRTSPPSFVTSLSA